MNKKGFSLVELLAAVFILAILMLLVIPQVYRYINKGKQSYYKSLEKETSVAAIDYMQDYRVLLPRQVGHVSEIDINDLVNYKYIDEIKDENGNKCGGKVIVEKTKKDSYEYYACLECSTDGKVLYKTEDTNCSKSVNDNVYADSDLYYLVAEKEEFEVEQMTTFSSLDAHVKVYKKINDTESVPVLAEDEYLEGTPSEIKVTDLTPKQIVYYYHGATLTVKIKGVDSIKPGAVAVNLIKSKNNKKYNGEWYSGDIIAKFKSTDYSSKGVSGSGVDYYEVSSDGINFTRINGNTETLTEEGEYTRYVRAIDKNGNVSDIVPYLIKIDKTKPTCTWDGESTEWINTAPRLITSTCHDDKTGIATSGCTKVLTEFPINETVKQKTLSYTMKDRAGNTETCTRENANIYLDMEEPTLTVSSTVGISFTVSNPPINYFTIKPVISDIVSKTCVVEDTSATNPVNGTLVTDVNQLRDNTISVRCTVVSGSGLSSTAKTTFKHEYKATYVSRQCPQQYACGTETVCPCGRESCDPWTCPGCEGECWPHPSCYQQFNASCCKCAEVEETVYCTRYVDCSYYRCDIDPSEVELVGDTCHYR